MSTEDFAEKFMSTLKAPLQLKSTYKKNLTVLVRMLECYKVIFYVYIAFVRISLRYHCYINDNIIIIPCITFIVIHAFVCTIAEACSPYFKLCRGSSAEKMSRQVTTLITAFGNGLRPHSLVEYYQRSKWRR